MLSLLLLLVLQGCSKPQQYTSGHPAAEAAAGAAAPPPVKEPAREQFLAYEHSVTIDAPEAEVKPLLDKLVSACNADVANRCTLLASGIEGGRESRAHVRVRIKRAGVDKLIAVAAAGGEVASRNTAAEDLEGPIRDNAKRLEMLRNYQKKLEALESKVGNNPEALIKLSEELSTVQSNLEYATGAEAHLMERVNLDLLNISIQSHARRSFWSPVRRSLDDFGSNLSEGIATAVTGLAYLLPWSFILLLSGAVARRMWQRLRRKKSAGYS